MSVHPYIHYPGTCREALALYARAFGTEPHILTRADAPADPEHPVPEAVRNQVMHSTLQIGGATMMFADTAPDTILTVGNNITLMVANMEPDAIDEAFAVLAEGGQVTMPPQETFWSPRYAQLTDRFGIGWQLSAEPA
ncbi:MAG: VOC family protein [Anaerolineae bacterium]